MEMSFCPWIHFPKMGKWTLKESNLTISCPTEHGYEIDLERITGPQELTFWIFHMHGKTWVQNDLKILTDLVEVFEWLFDSLCHTPYDFWPKTAKELRSLIEKNIAGIKKNLANPKNDPSRR